VVFFFITMQEDKLEDIAMNFIIGPVRSGTTLLVMLLNEIEECIATPEIKHIIYFYKKYKNVKSIDYDLLVDYQNYLATYRKASNNPLYRFNGVLNTDTLPSGKINYAKLSKAIHLQLHSKQFKTIRTVFDKNNFYTFYVNELKAIYPKAKFCVMMRDPRAFVASNLESQHKFKENNNAAYFAFVWRSYMKKVGKILNQFPDDIFLLKYEELVSHKEDQMTTFCSFFDLQYSPKIFDFRFKLEEQVLAALKSQQINDRMAKKIGDLSKPIANDRIDSWKNKLSKNQQSIVACITHKVARDFGYVMDERPSYWCQMMVHIRYCKSWIRVVLFFKLKSIKLHHYLNVAKRATYNEKMKNMNAKTAS